MMTIYYGSCILALYADNMPLITGEFILSSLS
jgi:hypothetical protein